MYKLKNNTIIHNGFPMTLKEVVDILNSSIKTNQGLNEIQVNKENGFDIFWSLYPKKADKVNARKKWISLRLFNHKSMQECINGLK